MYLLLRRTVSALVVESPVCLTVCADMPVGDQEPLQLQPCSVLRQQHAKSVTFLKLTPSHVVSAGADGRICRYHW